MEFVAGNSNKLQNWVWKEKLVEHVPLVTLVLLTLMNKLKPG